MPGGGGGGGGGGDSGFQVTWMFWGFKIFDSGIILVGNFIN